MAEWLGELLGQLPGWLILPVLLVGTAVAVEIMLNQNGDSLTDIWKGRNGKK